jgi:hypothetical protein
MNIARYCRMYDELAEEIIRNQKKIKSLKETIALLKKLQIAEQAQRKSNISESPQAEYTNREALDNQG